jgi:hypothetical protein
MKIAPFALAFVAGAACALTLAAVQDSKGTKAAGNDKPALFDPNDPNSPGMKAWMEAATPGKMHEWLAKDAGHWTGTCTQWMLPDSQPTTSSTSMTNTMILGGRYLKQEYKGEMPGFGTFEGFSIVAYDNAAKRFQNAWVDNMGTGMMTGTGELSSDEKTLNWAFSFYCPIQQKQCSLREVLTRTGDDTCVLDMYTNDESGKEYKCMHIDLKRDSKAATTASAAK